jgi:hypothetical protein
MNEMHPWLETNIALFLEMAIIHVGIEEIHVEMIAMDVIHSFFKPHPFDLNGFNTHMTI